MVFPGCCLIFSLYHHPCIKVFPYERFCVWIIYEIVHQGHEFVLRHIIEELLQVDINYVCISIIEIFKQFDNCLLGSAVWSESIAILTKVWFCNWGQYLRYCLLNDSIYYCWDSKISYSSIWLWYFYSSYRLWFVLSFSESYL